MLAGLNFFCANFKQMRIIFIKKGYKILAYSLITLLILNIIVNIIWTDQGIVKWAFFICSLCSTFFLLFFFRLPRDHSKPTPDLLCSSCGKVVVIEETMENEYFKDMPFAGFNFYVPF